VGGVCSETPVVEGLQHHDVSDKREPVSFFSSINVRYGVYFAGIFIPARALVFRMRRPAFIFSVPRRVLRVPAVCTPAEISARLRLITTACDGFFWIYVLIASMIGPLLAAMAAGIWAIAATLPARQSYRKTTYYIISYTTLFNLQSQSRYGASGTDSSSCNALRVRTDSSRGSCEL